MDLSNLRVLRCNGFNIQIHSDNKPVLDGGKALFNQENSKAYVDLPYIKVPIINEGEWHLEIKHRSGSSVLFKKNEVIAPGCEMILLSYYITEGSYGEYDIKLFHRSGINGRFTIEYVPKSTFLVDKNEYWPSSYQGYSNNIQSIRTSAGVEIEIFNAEKTADFNRGDHNIFRFKVDERDRFLIGEYKYTFNGNVFSTSIKKSIHPISWGIIGIENEIIDLSSRVYKLTLEDFSNANDPYLLFAFDFNFLDDIQYLKLDLLGAAQTVEDSKYLPIKNKDGLRISLNSYLFEMQNGDSEIDYQLCVSLLDSNKFIVANFLVARIQEEVVVENVQYSQVENEVLITWKESGTCIGRECVMLNFLKPWIKPYRFNIPDKICELKINTDHLEKGIYRYLIQKEKDDLFLDEVESEICLLRDFHKGKIVVKDENGFSSDMERILYQLLRTRFIKKEKIQKRLDKIESEMINLKIKVPEDISLLSYAYILHERFFLDKDDAQKVKGLFDSLFDLFSDCGKETIRYVLESDFSFLYKKKLLHKFYGNNLTSTTKFNDLQLKLLANIDEDMAGFINLIQDQNMRGLNWAGISDIGVLKEDDLFGEGDSEATFLSDVNLGNSSYITKYYQYVANSLLHPKNISKKTVDFIKEFQNEQPIDETKIFGKTRLHLLAEWKESNKDFKDTQNNLSDILNYHCKEELKHQFKDAFLAISKRKNEDELGYYIGLVALNASFIRNGLMQERKGFGRLLNCTIEKCGKLYYRDALVLELYMHLERGFSWA